MEILAHDTGPLLPHDVAGAWNLDPIVLSGIAITTTLYVCGVRPGTDTTGRRVAFAGGITALLVALVSPLDAMAGVLVSAHMAQHVLLVLVAAPLLAVSAPTAAIQRGAPGSTRTMTRTARRTAGIDAAWLHRLRAPVARWLLYVATLWLWHASLLYGAAVENDLVHFLEHATFLSTALLVWSLILGPSRTRLPRGLGVLAVFTLALQGVFLAALMTFARTPWYEPYLDTTPQWGLDPLADQQLAGVIMWIPAGLIHAAIAMALLAAWFRELDAPPSQGTSQVRAG